MAILDTIRLIFTSGELEGLKLEDFYKLVALTCGMPFYNDSFRVDCTKINVAQNIQEMFIESYKHLMNEGGVSDEDSKSLIFILLAQSGPKAMDYIPDNTVEVFNGAFLHKDSVLPLRMYDGAVFKGW